MHRTSRTAPLMAALFLLSLITPTLASPPATALSASALAGVQQGGGEESWSGLIAGSLEFYVTFTPAPGGGYTATLDIPAQGLDGYPVSDVVYTDTEISFSLPIAPPSGAVWRATRQPGADTAEGELEQGATKVPITMERLAEGEDGGPVRPQTPQPPFPYGARDVRYVNERDATELAGTLTVPEGDGPFPGVLLISGSGPQNRDEELLGHK
ncbi:MAG: hypothetical protein PVJ51_12670, partial [Acidobacteriota bacterium]